jgi:hypothetical protein
MGVAVAGLAFGATPQLSYEASLETELRTGNGLSVVINSGTVGTEIAAIPSLTLTLTQPNELFSLQYDPQLLLPLSISGTGVLALQRVKAVAYWSDPPAEGQITFTEEFQYGTTDFFSLSRTTSSVIPGLQPLPVVTTLLYVFNNTQVAVARRLSRTWQLSVTAGYMINGGADALAQLSLPLQSGPYVFGTLRKEVSALDDLETGALIYGARFSTTAINTTGGSTSSSSGSTNILGEATEGWIHRWTRYFRTGLAAGASGVLESPVRGAPYSPAGYPVARATAKEVRQTSRGRTLTADLLLELAPYVDRLTGNAYERTQVLGSVDWRAPLGVGFSAQGGYALPLYGNLQGSNVVELVGGTLTYQPQPFLRFDAGIRGVWQQPLPGVVGPSYFQWVALVGVLLKAGGPL